MFVFGANSGDDVVLDFGLLIDSIRLADGVTLTGSNASDVNGDGFTDLRLEFNDGASATLLGVASLTGVKFESGAARLSAQDWGDSMATFDLLPVIAHHALFHVHDAALL